MPAAVSQYRRCETGEALPTFSLDSPDMIELLTDISTGLDDPYVPSTCPACVFSFGTRCLHPELRDRNVRILRTSHAPLLSKMMLFLTADRHGTTHDDITGLLHSAMLACPRRYDPSHARLSESFAAKRCWLKMVCTISTIINNCFPPVSERRIETKKFKFGRHWPSGPEDILPHGSRGYRGLTYWLSAMDDVPVANTLMRVFLWCRPAFYAEFAQETSRLHFLQAICVRFDSCISGMSEQYQSGAGTPLDDSHRTCAPLRCLAAILIDIADFGRAEWPEWPQFFRGFESSLLEYATAAISFLAEGSHLILQLRDLSVDLYACRGSHSLSRMPPDLLSHYFEEQVSYEGVFGHFKHLLHALASRRMCAAPDCPNPILISNSTASGKRSFRCGSCRNVQYCSRACQRRHWRNPAQSHKAICGILRALAAYTSPDIELSKFSAACHDEHLDVHELAVIYTYLIGHRLVPNFDQEHFNEVADDIYGLLRSVDLLHDVSVARSSTPERARDVAAQLNSLVEGSDLRRPSQIVPSCCV